MLCIRLILASHTDPVTGNFTGLDLTGSGGGPSPLEREGEGATAGCEDRCGVSGRRNAAVSVQEHSHPTRKGETPRAKPWGSSR